MEIGQGAAGEGVDAVHVTTVLGPRDGPVGVAWATALATPAAPHVPLLVDLQPGLPVKPLTLLVARSGVDGAAHLRLTRGAAQAGIAAGVADAVAAGVVPEEEAEDLLCIAAVDVDPAAADAEAVFANCREAVRAALVIGRASLPAARDAAGKRGEAWNAWFRPQPR